MPKIKDKTVNEEPLKDQDKTYETVEGNDENEVSTQETDTPVIDFNDQLAQERDKYLRLYSEFENFRRRTTKDRLDWMQTASKEVGSKFVASFR